MRGRRIFSRFLADGQDLDEDVDYSFYKKKVPTLQKRKAFIVGEVLNQFFADSRSYRRPTKVVRRVEVTSLNLSKDDSDVKKESVGTPKRTKDEYDIRKRDINAMDIIRN